MRIHTNAPVNAAAYIVGPDGTPIAIPVAAYKCQVKKDSEDTAVVLTFTSEGGVGVGTLAITSGEVEINSETVTVDMFNFQAAQSLVASIAPGAYVADVLRADDAPGWVLDFEIEFSKGPTSL